MQERSMTRMDVLDKGSDTRTNEVNRLKEIIVKKKKKLMNVGSI